MDPKAGRGQGREGDGQGEGNNDQCEDGMDRKQSAIVPQLEAKGRDHTTQLCVLECRWIDANYKILFY